MSEALAEQPYYTREEYLAMEEQAEYKSEYYAGEIFAMAGGSRNHSVICFNLHRRIGEALDTKDCVGFDSNMKLDIPKANLCVYPDVMVVCGEIEFSEERTDIIKNPVLVIEVLSPSTESFDRGKKFSYYQTLPSLREYALISQAEPRVEVFFRQSKKIWQYTNVFGLEKRVTFQSIQSELALQDIYQKVAWEAETPAKPDK